MSIKINGDNHGIVVDGDLTIHNLEFQFGKGVVSASGVECGGKKDAEIVEAIPVIDDRKCYYPEITQIQKDFFQSAFVIRSKGVEVPPEVIDMPIEWIMHTIYDLTSDWDPSHTSSVRKWKVLYQYLKRNKFIHVDEKEKYAQYVKAIVMYCFPDTAHQYNSNISKTQLDNHFENWSDEDKKLFMKLKEQLIVS